MKKGLSLLVALAMLATSSISQAGIHQSSGVSQSLRLTRTPDQQFTVSYCTSSVHTQNGDCSVAGTYSKIQTLQVIEALTQDRSLLSRAFDYILTLGGGANLGFFASNIFAVGAIAGSKNGFSAGRLATVGFGTIIIMLGSVIYAGIRTHGQHQAARNVNQAALENLLQFVNSTSSETESFSIPAFWTNSPAELIPAAIAN